VTNLLSVEAQDSGPASLVDNAQAKALVSYADTVARSRKSIVVTPIRRASTPGTTLSSSRYSAQRTFHSPSSPGWWYGRTAETHTVEYRLRNTTWSAELWPYNFGDSSKPGRFPPRVFLEFALDDQTVAKRIPHTLQAKDPCTSRNLGRFNKQLLQISQQLIYDLSS